MSGKYNMDIQYENKFINYIYLYNKRREELRQQGQQCLSAIRKVGRFGVATMCLALLFYPNGTLYGPCYGILNGLLKEK
jgi:hypothetical protein